MKKSFQFILYLGVILLFIPSCNNTSTYINYNSSNTDTVDEGDIFVEEVIDSDSADNLPISNVYSSYQFETIDTYETDNSGSIKFDLNYDGISEELYANGNGYEIKMFYSGNSIHNTCKNTILLPFQKMVKLVYSTQQQLIMHM